MSARPLAYDVTHLVSRLNCLATSGIDRVDLQYLRALSRHERLCCGLHYTLGRPNRFSVRRIGGLEAEYIHKLHEEDALEQDSTWPLLRQWLISDGSAAAPSIPLRAEKDGLPTFLRQCAMRLVNDRSAPLPEGAIYLNVAQSAFEHDIFFRWLHKRPDILPVFFVHDFLPLDYPEFFKADYRTRFDKRVRTILTYARALIVSSRQVRARIALECERRGCPAPIIHVQPLASPLGGGATPGDHDPEMAQTPYFVLISTIEPRKNHLLMLHIWRAMAAEGDAPRLVLVGGAGWESEQTRNLLNRSGALKNIVRHVNGLSREAMRRLIVNARAVLMPSFAEGYGLPIVESLTLGTPAIVSDIPIFHEVSQETADYASPLDGAGWMSLIRAFSVKESPARVRAKARSALFQPPDWSDYFAGVERFMDSL